MVHGHVFSVCRYEPSTASPLVPSTHHAHSAMLPTPAILTTQNASCNSSSTGPVPFVDAWPGPANDEAVQHVMHQPRGLWERATQLHPEVCNETWVSQQQEWWTKLPAGPAALTVRLLYTQRLEYALSADRTDLMVGAHQRLTRWSDQGLERRAQSTASAPASMRTTQVTETAAETMQPHRALAGALPLPRTTPVEAQPSVPPLTPTALEAMQKFMDWSTRPACPKCRTSDVTKNTVQARARDEMGTTQWLCCNKDCGHQW